jgi:SOS response regulatory protein OraA/RecX
MDKKSSKILNQAILEVVENQLRADNPPETRKTFERLLKEGFDEQEAKQLIASVVAGEVFDVLKQQQPYDHERFVKALNQLP